MSGSIDIAEAVVAAWDDADLDDLFTALWAADDVGEYPVLQDREATPGQPFPYVVFEQQQSQTIARMSKGKFDKWEIRDVPFKFTVYAGKNAADARSPKKIASDLAGEIIKVFGGNSTQTPATLELTTGNFLIAQYQNDFGTMQGDDQHAWEVNYIIRVDIPVRTG